MSYTVRQNPAHPNNYTEGREGKSITEVIIHHAATTSFDGIATTFQNPNRAASAHYGVGRNNNVDQYVQEGDTAWHCGNWSHNQKSIGIENVNMTGAPDWLIDEATFNTLCELVADIVKRNPTIGKLQVGKNLFGHKDVSDSPTACPKNLEPRLQELADRVNGVAPIPPQPPQPDQILHIGEKFKFTQTYTVDDIIKFGGIWQVRTNALCPVDFTWYENGIPVMPLTEIGGGTNNPNDQVLYKGSKYVIPGIYTVLNLGQYKGRWLAYIDMQGWKLWVDIETVTEV